MRGGTQQGTSIRFHVSVSVWAHSALHWCLVLLRWPRTGTPWGTSGPVGATAEPRWPSSAPGTHSSGSHAARWTVVWGSCQGPTSTSGLSSTGRRDRVIQCHKSNTMFVSYSEFDHLIYTYKKYYLFHAYWLRKSNVMLLNNLQGSDAVCHVMLCTLLRATFTKWPYNH